jgi:hypothetical protein
MEKKKELSKSMEWNPWVFFVCMWGCAFLMLILRILSWWFRKEKR